MVLRPGSSSAHAGPRWWLLLLLPLATGCSEALPTDPIGDATSPTYVIANVAPVAEASAFGATLSPSAAFNRVGTASAPEDRMGPIRAYYLPPGHFSGLEGVALRVRLRAQGGPGYYWGWVINWGDELETITLLDRVGEFVFLRTEPYAVAGTYTINVLAIHPVTGFIAGNLTTTVTVP
jgi:hypothetical protein